MFDNMIPSECRCRKILAIAVVILDEVAEAMKANAGHVGEICPLRHNLHDLLDHWLHLLYGEIMKLGHVHEPFVH